MKKIIVAVIYIFTIMSIANSQNISHMNLYNFKVTDIDGKEFDMSSLKNKKVMIVNVASKCGFTPQYEELQDLYDSYKDKGFVIIGFPANNFKNQEPGTNEEIKEFCANNYSITFPLMEKISVKGDDIAPIYEWLTNKKKNGVTDQEVTWNFQKYLIDEHGNIINVLMPKDSPKSKVVLDWLEGD